MHFPESKLKHAGTSIFAVMTALANEHKAINLSQGFPDFAVSTKLVDYVNDAMRMGYNQYAPMPGVLSLRDAICAHILKRYNHKCDPVSECTVTAGATQALYTAITAIVSPGDEVIVFEPAYDCYLPAIELNGGIPKLLHLKGPGFHIDWSEVKSVVSKKTRAIIINSPHNPSGTVLTPEDMRNLEEIVSGTGIIIISDEVYEQVIFDGIQHESVLRYPSLASRSYVIYSFGKTYHATGWKVGYCISPPPLMDLFRKIHQYMVFSVNTAVQHGLAAYMNNQEVLKEISVFYQEQRDYFLNAIKKSRFKPLACSGSYFQLVDYSSITDEKDTDYAIRLTKESGVAAIPVSVFYRQPPEQKLLRFCFAKQKSTLDAAAEKLCMV